MASLETVIRGAVFPVVTPPPPSPAALSSDPNSGFCVLNGGSGQVINLSHSRNGSFSKQKQREMSRRYDVLRVSNPDDPDQFVDVEAVTKLLFKDQTGKRHSLTLAKPQVAENIETLSSDNTRTNSDA